MTAAPTASAVFQPASGPVVVCQVLFLAAGARGRGSRSLFAPHRAHFQLVCVLCGHVEIRLLVLYFCHHLLISCIITRYMQRISSLTWENLALHSDSRAPFSITNLNEWEHMQYENLANKCIPQAQMASLTCICLPLPVLTDRLPCSISKPQPPFRRMSEAISPSDEWSVIGELTLASKLRCNCLSRAVLLLNELEDSSYRDQLPDCTGSHQRDTYPHNSCSELHIVRNHGSGSTFKITLCYWS